MLDGNLGSLPGGNGKLPASTQRKDRPEKAAANPGWKVAGVMSKVRPGWWQDQWVTAPHPGCDQISGPAFSSTPSSGTQQLPTLSRLRPWKRLPWWNGGRGEHSKDREGERSLPLPRVAHGSTSSQVLSVTSSTKKKLIQVRNSDLHKERPGEKVCMKVKLFFFFLLSDLTDNSVLKITNGNNVLDYVCLRLHINRQVYAIAYRNISVCVYYISVCLCISEMNTMIQGATKGQEEGIRNLLL